MHETNKFYNTYFFWNETAHSDNELLLCLKDLLLLLMMIKKRYRLNYIYAHNFTI